MAILCYVTSQIKKDATTHGIAKVKLDEFAREVEKRQSLACFDHFPPPCLTKKKIFGFNYRMIAIEKHVGDNLVVVLLRLVVRGGNEYADFLREPSPWATRQYEVGLNNEDLIDWVKQHTEIEPPPQAPSLSDTERTFLWTNTHSDHHDDAMVCETDEWVDGIKEQRVADRLILLPELVLDAISRPSGEVHVLHSRTDDKLALLAFNGVGTNQVVLLSVSYADSESELRSRGDTWLQKLGAADVETVLRYSRRSYPSIILGDDDMWMTVQKDPQANLALSPEEAEILRSSRMGDVSRPAFPLFINGRAGSGKSTLLQYLFAECVLRWSAQFPSSTKQDSRPLYFASSRELLKVAKEVVSRLLKANHENLLRVQPVDDALLSRLDECFQDSLFFLRSAVGEEAETRFPMSNYVSYATFRRRWTDHFGKEKKAVHEYGPQISWHVIRGFIKGMSIDDLLAKADYDELPQNERTVSRAVYETVYDRVWAAWYEPLCRSGDAWDSQDLVRYLLDNDQLPASHVAVFCDEAQDFTRLELEALYRCSLFSDRQLDIQSLKRVPFVFAGDPFQTLNPTGFRWESVRAAFTERILRSLYRFNPRAEVPQLSYKELTFNYRSSPRIVHLCNSIQAVRACLFDHRSLSPQSTWQLDVDSSAPVFFEKGDTQMESALREQSDLVLIVPCEEGEEIEYVANDSYLKTIVQSDDDGTPRNVLSAARAKGLEFLRVALYGWSSRDEARSLANKMRSPSGDVMTVDDRLGLEYFMNNLYVAASRARRRLFVIDEQESREGLWWFASDEQHLSQLLRDLPRRDDWEASTGLLVRGVPESFKEDRDDPRAIAERFEREGLSKEDSYLLKQASLQFTIAGDGVKADECRAIANLFDGRYREAGEHFNKAGLVEKAIDAYWRGRLLSEIKDCARVHPDFARLPQCRVASFSVGESQTVRECRSLFEQLLENVKINEQLRTDLKSRLWKEALSEALKRSVGTKDNARANVSPADTALLADVLVQLEGYGAEVDVGNLARLFFEAQRYGEVLRRLDHDDGSDIYKDANALALIEQVESSRRPHSTVEGRIVADYYFRQKDYEAASRLYQHIRAPDRVLECLRQSPKEKTPQTVDAILATSLATLVANAEWESLISLLTNGDPQLRKQDKWTKSECGAVLEHVRHERMILRIVVPALARSDKLSSADAKSQLQVSGFLANQFVRTASAIDWQDVLSREVAGAAIERAGKDIDALKFYENWRDARVSKNEREYAERRWVICKLRQASREDRDGHDKKAASYRQDAAKVMEKHKWAENDVSDKFPELSANIIDVATAVEERTEPEDWPVPDLLTESRDRLTQSDNPTKLGSLSYRVITSKGWINIESDDGLCARVLVRERRVTSDDITIRVVDGGNVECNEWGLQIRWVSDGLLQFVVGQMDCEIHVGEG